jgi:dTDP-4-dehydrorhamnose 3,5-epimerase
LIFSESKIRGAYLIRPQRIDDERGFFARTFCVRELAEHGIDARCVQRSLSFNKRRGTLRGVHYQEAPHEENKLVTCTAGAIYDVIVDLRRDSPTFREWATYTLTCENLDTLFVPGGCGHGFMTLADESMVRYDISEFYVPEAARGVRFDDPAFGIDWPFTPTVISPRDLSFAPFRD